jgi:hypothetical protein
MFDVDVQATGRETRRFFVQRRIILFEENVHALRSGNRAFGVIFMS